MAEAKRKEGEFDEFIMGNMCNALEEHTFALAALAELITTSTLEAFAEEAGGYHSGENLRLGLLKIFELYLERQQKIQEEYLEKFDNLDLVLLKRGKTLLELVKEGAFNKKEKAQEKLHDAIAFLDVVIEREGELKPAAEKVKGACAERLEKRI